MIAKHQFQRNVRFAETDASGFAYFDTYIRMMEETEYSFLRSRDLRVVLNDGKGIIGFPRISVRLSVSKPLQFEDQADIELRLCVADGKQVVYDFSIQHDGESAAEGTFTVACCRFPADADPYAILTPEFVLEKLTAL